MFEIGLDRTVYEITDWSRNHQFDMGVSLFANYFNVKNSHWEPLIESWHFSINGRKNKDKSSLVFLCRKKLELNITYTLLETVFQLMEDMKSAQPRSSVLTRETISPYKICNKTGYDIIVWNDSRTDVDLVDVKNSEEIDWRFVYKY
jgi:vacuolar protein sorting-associated protein 13A/C